MNILLSQNDMKETISFENHTWTSTWNGQKNHSSHQTVPTILWYVREHLRKNLQLRKFEWWRLFPTMLMKLLANTIAIWRRCEITQFQYAQNELSSRKASMKLCNCDARVRQVCGCYVVHLKAKQRIRLVVQNGLTYRTTFKHFDSHSTTPHRMSKQVFIIKKLLNSI